MNISTPLFSSHKSLKKKTNPKLIMLLDRYDSYICICTLLIIQYRINRYMNFKIIQKKAYPQSTLLAYDCEKENHNNSDLQSLLVSSVRCDTQALNDIQGNISKPRTKATQSLIKKQYANNVYVDDRGEGGFIQQTCQCDKKIQSLNQTIKLLTLKLQQCESKITLCFSKFSQNSQKISEQQKLGQEMKYICWQNKERLKQISSTISKVDEQRKYKMQVIDNDISKMQKAFARWEGKQNQKVSTENRMLQHKLQKYKADHDHKLNTVVQTIESLSQLQRKLIEHQPLDDPPKSTYPDEPAPRKKKYYRGHSICQKSHLNESTNISFSRNYELPR